MERQQGGATGTQRSYAGCVLGDFLYLRRSTVTIGCMSPPVRAEMTSAASAIPPH